jgi:hypothetical protein
MKTILVIGDDHAGRMASLALVRAGFSTVLTKEIIKQETLSEMLPLINKEYLLDRYLEQYSCKNNRKKTRGRTVFYIQKICFFDYFTRKTQTRIITHRR